MKSSDIDQDLFTDSYCKVCSAQLISESQRVAHYEVRTASPTLCVQMEARVAWVKAVGLEGAAFWTWGRTWEAQGLSQRVWDQARTNVHAWGWRERWGCHSQAPGCSPNSGFFLCLSAPGDPVGFLYLLNLSLLVPEVPFRDTAQVSLVPASLSFSDPEEKLRGPFFITGGKHSSISGSAPNSSHLLAASPQKCLLARRHPPAGWCPSFKAQILLKDIIHWLWLFRMEVQMAAFWSFIGKRGWEERGRPVSEEGMAGGHAWRKGEPGPPDASRGR